MQKTRDKDALRACGSCRTRKIRCILPLSSGPRVCQPCALSDRECIFTEPSRKRQRKRTDARVTELEEQVKALSAAVDRQNLPALSTSAEDYDYSGDTIQRQDNAGQVDQIPWHGSLSSSNTAPPGAQDTYQYPLAAPCSSTPRTSGEIAIDLSENPALTQIGDVIDRGLISMEEASRLLRRYMVDLVQHFPVVPLPEGITLIEMREKRPILLLSVLAAAAGASNVDLNMRLNLEIQQTYADLVAMKGEKSLELVQSILVTITWYCPPDRFDQLKFYQYLHMAWSMALDIGLDKDLCMLSAATQGEQMPSSDRLVCGLIDGRRSLLSCYLMCCMASVALRRPNMVRFSTLMAECVDLLEASADAVTTDRRLCAWVRLQCIMEQCAAICSMDDPSKVFSLEESRVRHMMKSFEKQIRDWKEDLAPGIMNESLMIFYHVNIIYLYEMVMYVDHDPEDFRPPFVVKRVVNKEDRSKLPPAYIDAVSTIHSSTQALLDAFLCLDMDGLRALPIVSYVRVTYSVVVLIKLSLSAMAANNPLGQLLDAWNIQATAYQDKVITHLARAIGSNRFRVAGKFFMVVLKLKSWYVQHAVLFDPLVNSEEQIKPCEFLGPEHDPYVTLPISEDQTSHRSEGVDSLSCRSHTGISLPQHSSVTKPAEFAGDWLIPPIHLDLSLVDMRGLESEGILDMLPELGMDPHSYL